MSEFAETLGTQQSTISRYEGGKLVPSKSILILLYLLAVDDERPEIADALGIPTASKLEKTFLSAHQQLDALKSLSVDLARSDEGQTLKAKFAEDAVAVVNAGELDPVLVELMELLRSHPQNHDLKIALSSMLPYFRFCAKSD